MDQSEQDATDVAEALGKEYMESMFTCTSRYYVDAEFLVDFRLTAVLCLMNDKDYEIVKKHMPVYNARTRRGTVKYFPKISVTEDQIDAYLKDPDLIRWTERLQYTTYLQQFVELVRAGDVQNRLAGHDEPIIVYIGCNGLPLPKIHSQNLVNHVLEGVPTAEVTVTQPGLTGYSEEVIRSTQHFSFYNLQAVINNPAFSTHIETGLFTGRGIHAYPFITTDNPGMKEEEVLSGTLQMLNMFFNFDYVTMKVQHHE